MVQTPLGGPTAIVFISFSERVAQFRAALFYCFADDKMPVGQKTIWKLGKKRV